jgi:hypothetical protein
VEGLGQRSLGDVLQLWHGLAARPVATAAELTANMQALYDAIYLAEFEMLDPAEVKAHAGAATDVLFDLYLTLRDRVPEWKARGLIGEGTPIVIRNAMRVLRYTIDIVGEVANDYRRLGPGENPYKVFAGPDSCTLMHPAFAEGQRVALRPGDIVMMRGRLNNSAAIARIGDADSQFSHVGIVHIDRDGGRWFVEALIEDGSVLTPLDEALSHGTGRAVLFRHRDQALAARAAELAAERVKRGNRGLFGWIPYDFTMEPKTGDTFFCSKLVRYAFREASAGAMVLPAFPTHLSMTNRDFFDRLGVTAVETFAPGDLELEPAFDLVAEWRDYRVTSSLRMQDLLMSKLFDWMDAYKYQFQEGPGIAAAAILGRFTSIWPDVLKRAMSSAFGLPKIPRNMNCRMITTIGMLHKTAEPILQRLLALEAQRIETTGRPLHPREVQAELDRQQAHAGGRIGYLVAET